MVWLRGFVRDKDEQNGAVWGGTVNWPIREVLGASVGCEALGSVS